jgi:predicted GNAT superfamily acetyltransferase
MGGEAWELAEHAARAAGVRLRPLDRLEDAEDILRVMIATWGEHQLIPREMLRALGDSANPPIGAFDEAGGEMVGYVLGWIAADPQDGLVVHSHMLAALPDRRHRGVGYALKLAQRAQALDAGITVVRWTFDPLIARNAWFNLGKLRAVADRFHRNYYGEMTDIVNRGERTDRLVVRWDLAHERADVPLEGAGVLLDRRGDEPRPEPAPRGELPPPGRPVLVRIPRDHEAMRRGDPALARRWRDAVAEAIEACLATGRIARGFVRDEGYVFA